MMRPWTWILAALALLSWTGCHEDNDEFPHFTCRDGTCSYCIDAGCFDASWHPACENDGQCTDGQICILGGCCWTCSDDDACPTGQECREDGYCSEDDYQGGDPSNEPGCAVGESCDSEEEGSTPEEEGSTGEGEGEGAADPTDGGTESGSDCAWQPPLPDSCTYTSECPEGYLCMQHKCVLEK